VKLFQSLGDILAGGTSPERVGEAAAAVWQALNNTELEILPGKSQRPSQEIKSVGTWWTAGSAVIPPDTLRKIRPANAPVKEGVTTINGNFRILEEARTWSLCHFPPIIVTVTGRQTLGVEIRA